MVISVNVTVNLNHTGVLGLDIPDESIKAVMADKPCSSSAGLSCLVYCCRRLTRWLSWDDLSIIMLASAASSENMSSAWRQTQLSWRITDDIMTLMKSVNSLPCCVAAELSSSDDGSTCHLVSGILTQTHLNTFAAALALPLGQRHSDTNTPQHINSSTSTATWSAAFWHKHTSTH